MPYLRHYKYTPAEIPALLIKVRAENEKEQVYVMSSVCFHTLIC